MKTGFFKVILVAGLLLAGTPCIWSQGFINLDFESAILDPILPGQVGGSVSTTNAMPGWAAFIDGNQLTQVLQNNQNFFAPSISVLGPNWNNQDGLSVIQGFYTLLLTAGVNVTPSSHTNSVSQIGLVPFSATTLYFERSRNPGPQGFRVSFDDEDLSYVSLSKGTNYSLFGADISAFAGRTGRLMFSYISRGASYNIEYLDNIQFSSMPIPEPGSLALAALGTLLLSRRCRRNKRVAAS